MRRILALWLALGLGVAGSQGQTTTSPALKTGNAVNYQIKMTTQLEIPAAKDKIDEVRIYHALPTQRPWTGSTKKYGATNLVLAPKSAKELHHDNTDSEYALWKTESKPKPGTKLSFSTEMSVRSVDRSFDPRKAKFSWKEYEKVPTDKSAVINPMFAKNQHPELAALAAKWKKDLSPPEAVEAMCKWLVEYVKYNASVEYAYTDIKSIMQNRQGHCGHQSTVLNHFTAAVGIPTRTVFGMNLYAPDGRKSDLQKVRADFTNIHTWIEVYFPGHGWIELDPGTGAACFNVKAHLIQNNRWFQNYSVWLVDNKKDVQPEWIPNGASFRSDYQLENIISYTSKK